MTIKKICAGACLAALLFSAVPARAGLFEFTLQDEMKYGRQIEVLIKSIMPIVEDPEVKLYVQGIVDNIVSTLPPQPYKFETNVVLHPTLNAFAMPGGFVFVHTGLIQHLEHESQLAGVLAHEVAHVTQRHIAGRIQKGQIISLASMAVGMLGAVAGGGGDASTAMVMGSVAAGQAAILNYSRADESDADQFGLQYLVSAGYNPHGLGGGFGKIREMSLGRGSKTPAYLSTHPDITSRLTSLNSRLQSMSADILNRPENDERFLRVQTLIWARYGDTQHATQIFASRDPKNPMTSLGKGILATRQNKVLEAEAAFDEALKLAPRDALILREAGSFHYNKGDMGIARVQLESALKQDPDDYLARFYFARLLDDEGNSSAAQDQYRRVLRNVPDDAEVHSFYGRSLGASQQLFRGYLHLAYAAMYGNDERRTDSWLDKAKASVQGPQDEGELERFNQVFQERKKVWKELR